MLQDIADYHNSREGISFLLGDWNCIHTDETRLLSTGPEIRSDAHVANFFEETSMGFLDLRQLEHTFRRLARSAGAFSTFSRIDRIYTSAHPSTLTQYAVQAWVKGDLATRTSPSDPRAVEVDIRLRQRPPTQTQSLRYCASLLPHSSCTGAEHLQQRREQGCQVRGDRHVSARSSASCSPTGSS